jgi:hypothetical protein
MRVRKCGGAASKIADNAPGQYTASGLVADADAIYLAAISPVNGAFVRRIPKDGSAPTDLATNAKELFGLALVGSGDDEKLYWVERGGGSDSLREMRLADRSVTTVASLAVAYAYGPFLGDATGVSFFAQTGSNSGTFYTWTQKTLTSLAAGTSPVDLVPGLGESGAPDMYFSFGHTGANGVSRLSRSSPSSPVRIADASAPYGLVQRDRVLYFTESDTGSVMRWTLSDDGTWQMTFPVASGEDDPRFLAVDDHAIYWATWRGLLRRAPR